MQSSITRPRSQQTTYFSSLALRPPARRGALSAHLVYDMRLVSSTAFVRSRRRRGHRARQHSDETYVKYVPFTEYKRPPLPTSPAFSTDTPSLLVHSRRSIHPPSPSSSPEYGYATSAQHVSHKHKVSCKAALTHRRPSLSHRPPHSALSRACVAQSRSEGGRWQSCGTSAMDR